jgi:hypothetical protein
MMPFVTCSIVPAGFLMLEDFNRSSLVGAGYVCKEMCF